MWRKSQISLFLRTVQYTRAGYLSVLLAFLFYFISYFYFSRATVSAVLQPCRTCHMLFVLVYVVLYVFLANK